MNDRVHPMMIADDTESVRSSNSSVSGMESHLLKQQQQQKTRAQPGSYVIQIPKDQIYRVPPPENAHLFDAYTRRHRNTRTGPRRRPCRCVVWSLGVAALALLALATAAGVLYLVSRPQLPRYAVVGIRIGGLNNLSNPEFDIAIRAENPNSNVGIDYRGRGSRASVAYSGAALADGGGAWPAFYQGTRNVTVFAMALKGGPGVRRLSDGSMKGLRGRVPLEVDAVVPARVRLGSIASWTFKVMVRCDVVVDRLLGGSDAKIVSESCKANAAR